MNKEDSHFFVIQLIVLNYGDHFQLYLKNDMIKPQGLS